jgi:hypothetical protein
METRPGHLIGIQGRIASLTISNRGEGTAILLNLWPDSSRRIIKKLEIAEADELIRLLQRAVAQVRENER